MKDIVVCIPTIGLSEHLTQLINVLDHAPGICVIRLAVNSEVVPEIVNELHSSYPDLIDVVHTPELSIYEEWNAAIPWAVKHDAYAFFVTDDVAILPDTPLELVLALEARPDYGLISTQIAGEPQHRPIDVYPVSHQAGNRYDFATWCFMARPESWVDVDAGYKIWYGDDDLIWKVNEAGWRVGVLRGEVARHYTSTTSQQVPWVADAARQDGELWSKTH